jgi:photolyase PhrII
LRDGDPLIMIPPLPAHLAERVDPRAPAPNPDGRFVIYWMRIAARAFENPALDVALELGKALKRPVFVYHALSQRYRYASDRLHTFVLEGARDAHRDLQARGIGSVFHLEQGKASPVLLHLAKQASVVVSDYMPVEPLLRWDAQVALVAPLWRVDASCLAPVWGFTRPVERAFEFRALARDAWAQRIARPWPLVEPEGLAFRPEVPFTPLDLERANFSELIAGCQIDHSVAPVHHTPGGSGAGGLRWQRFLEQRLDAYGSDRSDPVKQGTSRLSAYLHFGHVSIFTVAREAAARRTEGASKFLDQLLTWRELAWHFCHHTPDHERLEALPSWAQLTLRKHERDPRPALFSAEQLARAQTGDALWDAAQRSLLAQGELHNSARMSWAKAVLQWTRGPAEALQVLIDLNHRYALDGRDPGSMLGILWALGGFDRPFSPELPILGTVRPRPLAEQGKRFDLAEFSRRTRRPARRDQLTVAIIGAGVSGAAAARTLSDAGHVVTLFDKGRGVGGRCATRHQGELRFDHGAQFFTVTDERFARWARAWWTERVVSEWKPRVVELGKASSPAGPTPAWVVAMPGMSSLVSRLLVDLDVRTATEVGAVVRDGARWRLTSSGGEALGAFDALVVSAPAPQAAALLDAAAYAFAARLREVQLTSQHALMAAFDTSLGLDWDAATCSVGPLRWLARDSHKPERPQLPGERWVFHASPEWSLKHLEEAPERIASHLLDAVFASTGARRLEPRFFLSHRWRYAQTSRPLGEPCLFEEALQLAACGDWCLGGGIEAAFLSGVAAAGRLNALAGPPREELDVPTRARPAQLRLID